MTGFSLKIIALLSMLLDHIVKAGFLHQGVLMERFGMSIPDSARLMQITEALGRLAFPIFAYMIAEGMRHTHSRPRYIMRLLIFGVISELPFDLALFPVGYDVVPWQAAITPLSGMNIYFTLSLGAAGIHCAERLRGRGRAVGVCLLPACACALAALLFSTDYIIFGVLLIYAAYFPTGKAGRIAAMLAVQAVLYLGYGTQWFVAFSSSVLWLFGGACIPLVLLLGYNGKRGYGMKWLFYWFYPVHLTVLAALRLAGI